MKLLTAQDIREVSSTQMEDLGSLAITKDGRKYRYAKAGGTALAPGLMNEQSAIVANHSNIAVSAVAAIGATKVSVTLGATAATKDQYKEGYLLVNDGTGEGIMYRIAGHAAAALSAGLDVYLEEPLIVALAVTTEVTLVANRYKGVIVVPSAAVSGGVPAGVANVAVTEAYYGYLQTGGPCAMLSGTTPQTLGDNVSQEATGVAGSASPAVATCPIYGVALQLGVATEYQLVNLQLD